MITVIHGPGGSGKSTNRLALAEYYGCKRIIDGWLPGTPRAHFHQLHAVPQDGDLVLTNASPREIIDALGQYSLRIRSIVIALKEMAQ